MASRKTATTEKPAKGSAAPAAKATKTAAAKKSTTARNPAAGAAKKSAASTVKSTAKKATTASTKKAPAKTAKRPAAAAAAPSKPGKPSARASKRELTPLAEVSPAGPQTPAPSFEAARLAAQIALDKKAEDVVILDVRGLTSYADYFVVASGTSDRHVNALADHVEEQMKKAGHRTIGVDLVNPD